VTFVEAELLALEEVGLLMGAESLMTVEALLLFSSVTVVDAGGSDAAM
jgi:hypothetical protein